VGPTLKDMDRRQFIKISGLTGSSATLASCGNPEYHLIRFIPEDRIVPGTAVWRPSICPLCPAGCGLIARVMDSEVEVLRNGQLGLTRMGLAKKLEGNPDHPINRGKLCTRGQAAAEITYHPDRAGHPLKRAGARGEGKFEEIPWDQALGELVSKLDALEAANDQKKLAILLRPQRGARTELIQQFAARFGAPAPVAFEFFNDDVLRRANALSFGIHQLPTFDLAESRYVLSFGADFLGTWNSPVAQNVGYGQMRQGKPGSRGKFVQVEYRMSQTGANADEWVAVRPGMEGVLALGIAQVIIKSGARRAADAGPAGMLIDGWSAGLTEYTPPDVSKRTGISTARIERLAKEFAEQKPAAVAIIAGAALAQTNGLFNALAVNALNALVGSVGTPGGVFFMPQAGAQEDIAGGPRSASATARSLNSGTPLQEEFRDAQILLIDGANPVYAAPPAWKVRETLMQVPYIVSFGNFIDETSVLADVILPDHSFLESWVQSMPESGAKTAVVSMAGPVMQPLHETRATGDVILDVARRHLKKWSKRDPHPRPLLLLRLRPIGLALRGERPRGSSWNLSLMAMRASMRFTFCRIRPRRCWMDRLRIYRCCRSCRIRCRARYGAVGWRSICRPRTGLGSGREIGLKSLRGRERSGFRRFHRRELLRTSWRCPPAKVTKTLRGMPRGVERIRSAFWRLS